MFVVIRIKPVGRAEALIHSLWGRSGFDGVMVGLELRVEDVCHLVKHHANKIVANNNNFFAARAVA